jgi:uncharacterized membrane protein
MFAAALLVGSLAACEEGSELFDPTTEGLQGTELDLTFDEELIEAILTDAEAAIEAADGPPMTLPQGVLLAETPDDPADVEAGRELLRQAREKFRLAREAWLHGDTELAAQLALEARLLVAEALVTVFGVEVYDETLLRVDNIIAWLEEEVDEQASDLLARIRQLRQEAEDIRAADPTDDLTSEENAILAMERLILAMQIGHRERVHQRRMNMAQHARHAIFMATRAIDLAAQIAGEDMTERQRHVLRHAMHLRNDALMAFNAGRYGLALNLGREATNLALVVVLLESGPDADKVAWLITVSDATIAAADEALLGVAPNSVPAMLLAEAKLLQARAIEISATHPRVAIQLLWFASITAWAAIELAGA